MYFHVRVAPITELPSRPSFLNPLGARVRSKHEAYFEKGIMFSTNLELEMSG